MGPLAGLCVVEIAEEISGPYCSKLLVDLGATVTKIELPGGDPLRSWGPFPPGPPDPNRSALFEYINSGKHGGVLDLAAGADAAAARALIEEADVLVDGLAPGTLDVLGLGHGALRAANPRLVIVRISDFGQSGPWHDRDTTPLIVQAASGWTTNKDLNRPPVQAGARIAEYVAGAYAALGTLTALRVRESKDGAIEVDVSAMEALLSTLPYPMLMAARLKKMGLPTNTRAAPMLGIVKAADGWIGINCLTGQHWLDVCAMIGLPAFGEHQIAIMMGGPEREKFFAKARTWLEERSVEEILELSQAMRIPAAPVGDGATVPELPQYRARKFFIDGGGEGWWFRRPGAPYRLSKSAVLDPRPAPRLGPLRPPQATQHYPPAGRSLALTPDGSLPFAGIKVLDLTTFWAGAYLTCYLGAFGADIVKVESIQRPDGHRFSGAFPHEGDDWYERSALWRATNLNKRDITLDLGSERGRELALRIAAGVDVVVENFSPRVLEQFGLDHDSLAQINQDVILVRMPGFGLEGPWRNYVGWALNIEQAAGMAAVTGYPDGPPCSLQGPADPIVGVHAGIALLAALEHRHRTGEGQLIEVAQIEVGAAVTAEPVIEYSMSGMVRPREGNRQRGYCQGVYVSVDDSWIALSVRDDEDWVKLAEVLERTDLLEDPRLGTAWDRQHNHDFFDEVVGEWVGRLPACEALAALQARGLLAVPLLTPDRMYDHPQLLARGFYEDHDRSITGTDRYPGWPFRITPGPTHHHRWGAPTLGQHNEEILEGLGLSKQQIAELREERVIGEQLLQS